MPHFLPRRAATAPPPVSLGTAQVASRDILDVVTDAVYAFDREWRFTYVNRAGEATARRSRDELVGQVLWELYPELRGTPIEAACLRAREHGTTEEVDCHYLDRLGSWLSARIYPAPDGVVSYVRDDTERRATEHALRASFESTPLATYAWQREGDDFVLSDFNAAAVRATNGRIRQEAGRRLGDFYADLPRLAARVRDTAAGIEPSQREEIDYVYRTTGERRRLAFTYVAPTPDLVLVYAEDLSDQRQAETLFRGISEHVATGVYVFQDDHFVYVNPRYAEMLGYTPEEMLALGESRLPADAAASHSTDGRAPCTATALRKDGTTIHLEIYATRIQYAGRPALLGTVLDVTRRRGTEAALRFQAHLLDAIREAVIATDTDGVVTYWNNGAATLYGWSAEEAVGQRIVDLLESEGRVAGEARIRELAAGRGDSAERTLRRRDGSAVEVTVSASPIHDASGTCVGLLGVSADIGERKRAEGERLALANHVRLLLESTTEGLYGVDPNGYVTFMNGAGAAALGYTPSELIGRHSHSVFHHKREDGTHFPEEECPILATVRAGESVRGAQGVLWRRDGSPLAVSFAASPVYADAELAGAVVAFTDETERRAAELALRDREAHLAAIVSIQQEVATARLDLSSVMQLVVDRAQALTGSSGAVVELVEGPQLVQRAATGTGALYAGSRLGILGSFSGHCVRQRELLRCDDTETDPRVDRDLARQTKTRSLVAAPLVHEGRAIGVIKLLDSTPGRFGDAQVRTLNLLSGLLAAAIGRAADREAIEALAADRATALEAVGAQEAQFRSLIEHAADPVVLIDADGRMKYVSPAFPRVLGEERGDLQGLDFAEFVQPDDAGHLRELLRSVVAQPGAVVPIDLRVRQVAGGYRTMTGTARNLLDDAAVHGIVVNLRDVSEQRQLEQQLRQALKMEAVGRLAGGIAHDFNNLLTVIKVNADFLLQDIGPDAECREEVEEIGKSANRAAALTRQLLAFSRQQVLRPRELDLNATVSDMGRMLGRLIGEDVELVLELQEGLGRVMADPGQVEQVIANLSVNARDAMPKGGRLTIRTANVEVDATHPRARGELTPGSYVVLRIADTGHGMDRATLERIFEPFFTTKPPGRGTGLGLSTVYGIVKQSGGCIGAESEPGRGTVLEVYLPRLAGTGAPVAAASPAASAGGSETLLVVEDESGVRSIARRVLGRLGYTVLEAANGREALEIVAAHEGPIHALVTDAVMPEMGGRDLAEALRRLRPGVCILYMSGYTDDDIIRRGLLEPGSMFLDKPFTTRSLARAVREVLDQGCPSATGRSK